MQSIIRSVGMIIVVLVLDAMGIIMIRPVGLFSDYLTAMILGFANFIISTLIWIIPVLIIVAIIKYLAVLYGWSTQTGYSVGMIVVYVGSVFVNWLSLYAIGTLTKLAVVPTLFEGGLIVGAAFTVPFVLIRLYDWAKEYM